MRICLYTNATLPRIGGREAAVDALARQLLALGHDPVVVSPQPQRTERFDPASLPYPVVFHPRLYSTRWFVASYGRWLARLHRQRAFDVVHCHTTYPNAYIAASCAALDGVPLVVTSHGDDLAPLGLVDRRPKLRRRQRFALQRADAVVAINSHTDSLFRAACPEVRHIEHIPDGVDLARFATAVARPADLPAEIVAGRYLLSIGRLDWRKGVDLLTRSFAAAASQCDLHLAVAGIGPELPTLEALAAGLGLSDRVHFLGRVDDATKTWLLQNSLAGVLPSRVWEASGRSVLESYAAGRPVLATETAGMAELVEPGRTGLLVPPDDCPRMTEAILEIARKSEQADRWGEEARQVAQQYDWSTVALRHLELFDRLIQGRREYRRAA